MTRSLRGATVLLAALASGLAAAQTPATPEATTGPALSLRTVVSGLEHPWSLAFLPDGDWLVTERPGRLRLVRDGRLLPQPVSGVPAVVAERQGGLLEVLPHPDFAANRQIYLSYARRCEGGLTTALARGRLQRDGDDARLEAVEDLLVADACAEGGRHFGGRLAFADDGSLFLSVGDRGQRQRAQDPHDHAGSVLRLRADGSAPADNPFSDGVDGDPLVWSYGHRNIQGMVWDDGLLWTHEHGPRGGDEINIARAGRNYGWPRITYGREYSGPRIGPEAAPGLEQPLTYWVPSIAPSGLVRYRGDAFPQWQGSLLLGALAGARLERIAVDGERVVGRELLLQGEAGRIRDVRQSPDGRLYLLTDAADGALLQVLPDAGG